MKRLQGPILITGGRGFLGKALVSRCQAFDVEVIAPGRADCDLRDPLQVKRLYQEVQPKVVIHAAAHGGGIGYMQQCPAEVYYDNIMMNTLMIHEASEHQVERFIGVGTVCSYPKYSTVPFKEGNLWEGFPEETNSAYGLAKKMMIVQLHAYLQQYGLKGFQLLFSNLYGPGDNFDQTSSHVIPALIRKCLEAKEDSLPTITLWGTGKATREFLYVDDAVDAIIQACEWYQGTAPVNIGVGKEITIRYLVELVREVTGYTGEICWDHSKPDGQPRRCLDVSLSQQAFGFQASTDLGEGLKKTVDWYRTVRNEYAVIS